MIIAFSGAGGTGKTTLAKKVTEVLWKKGYDVGYVPETARIVLEWFKDIYGDDITLAEIRSNYEMFMEFEEQLLELHFVKETRARRRHDIVVSDRTVYDPLIYTYITYGFVAVVELIKRVPKYVFDVDYDYIFMTHPFTYDEEILDDGVRTPDVKCIRKHHEFFNKTIGNVAHHVIVEDLDNRVKYVLNTIGLNE